MSSPLLDIIYEDADLLVVNKPADLVCHPTKDDEYSSLISRARIYLQSHHEPVSERGCVEDQPQHTASCTVHEPPLRHRLRGAAAGAPSPSTQQRSGDPNPHLIHRLDRETSGLVLITKNSLAARELGKIWETRAVRKEYLAIVHGHVAPDVGIIDAPLGRDETSRVAIKDCVRPDGSPAQTEFFVEKRFAHSCIPRASHYASINPNIQQSINPFTLLRLHPLTGRKHQIRIHLAHLGHPIVGDKIYGGDPDLYLALVERRLTDEQRARLILPQHALHASRIQFEWRGREWDFTAPLPAAFAEFAALGAFP